MQGLLGVLWSLGLHRGQQGAAAGTNVHDMIIRAVVQSIVYQVRGAVGQQRVALHLSEANPTTKLAALDGLPCQRIHAAGRPNLSTVGQALTDFL